MADAQKGMAERHRDEIAAIIAACEEKCAPHKEMAFYRLDMHDRSRPQGWSRKTSADAQRTIRTHRAQCSADIRVACQRQRAEANAKNGSASVTHIEHAGEIE